MTLINKLFNTLKDSVIKKSLYVLVLRASGSVLQILVLLLITNNASEQLVGQYNYFNSTIIVFSALTLLGMNSSFLQFSGKLEALGQFSKIVDLYKKKISILLIMYSCLLILYVIITQKLNINYFQDVDLIYVLNKVLIVLLPFSITLLNLEVLRALDLLYTSEILRNIGRFGILLVLVLVIIFLNKIELLFDVFILSFIILAIYSSLIIVLKMKSISKTKSNLNLSYSEIIKVSFPMSFSLISLLIMQSFDVYVLEKFYNFTTVAYYGIAIKITAVVGIILTSINATIAPQISKLFFKKNMTELNDVIVKATKLNVLLSIPLIIGIIIFSNLILSFFGDNYILAKQALFIILIGQIINTLCGPVGLYLNMTGRQVFFQRVLLIALIINVLMNIVLIPKYEMIGAAFSTAFSFTFWNISGLLYILKKDKINLSILRF